MYDYDVVGDKGMKWEEKKRMSVEGRWRTR